MDPVTIAAIAVVLVVILIIVYYVMIEVQKTTQKIEESAKKITQTVENAPSNTIDKALQNLGIKKDWDPARDLGPGEKTINNCMPWAELGETGNINGNYWCKTDRGGGLWSFARNVQGPCVTGWGMSVCVPISQDQQHWKNCVSDWDPVWGNPGLADQWCRDDFGPSASYAGAYQRAGCSAGFSRGLCNVPGGNGALKYRI